MNRNLITFSANEQTLIKTGGINNYASNTVSYIVAEFDLGENWDEFDSVRAIFQSDFETAPAVLAHGYCVIPFEVLRYRSTVRVNLVGSVAEQGVLIDRLTTFPITALNVTADALVDNSIAPISPSEFEEFVAMVRDDADRAEAGAESAESSASAASTSAQSAEDSALSASNSASDASASAQTAQEEAQKITGMVVVVTQLPEGATPTSDWSNGVLTIGIPKGDTGETGATGNGIESAVLNANYTLTLTFTDGTSYTTPSIRGATGATGATGNGISSVTLTSTSGAVKTYTIAFTDGTNTTFDVTDGEVTQAVLDEEITALKSEINGLSLSALDYGILFRSGSISASGGQNANYTNRICSGYSGSMPIVQSGDAYYCDPEYVIQVSIFSDNYVSTSNFITNLGDYSSGVTRIPAEYIGKYAGVCIKKVGHESEDISGDLGTISEHVKYKSSARSFEAIDTKFNSVFEDSNNLLPLPNGHRTYNGVDITVENGIITLSGTASADIRVKVSGSNYDVVSTNASIPASWTSETLPQFEIGETYSLHNMILSGTLPSNVGVSLRNSSKSVIISGSRLEAEITEVPAYAMLLISKDAVVDVSFVAAFIKGGVGDIAYTKKLSEFVEIPAIKSYAQPNLTASYIYDSTFEYAVKFPSAYSAKGDPTPLVIICHGLSATISESSWGAKTVADKFVNAGYAVMDVNQVTTQDWCNPDLIKKYISALKEITSIYNVVPKYVYGYSMGSLIGLCMATVVPDIRACAISGIRLDLEARYAQCTDSEKAIVDTNLGFTSGYDAYLAAGWCKTACACVDVNDNKINPIQFPPTIFIYGTTDTLTKEESLEKIQEIKRGGTICIANEYVGDHSAVCVLSAGTSLADTLAWFSEWA